ncbi:phage portal protein [Coprobacillaceae bacterium CR2/5/TPMF4]|nr:phage portal protein [Coprobacillaceae bacterium CR2/5/TPMF4]
MLPLYEGFEYEQLDNKGTQSTTRDFKALLDDVISMTANAFNVPSSIANGNVQDTSKAIDEFLTFCIDPLIEMLTDEMNRKSFSQYQIINGYYFKFNTLAIKHIDILDIANAIDKLLSSGFTCINDLRILIGLDPIDEEWANQFFMTKNYAPIEELLNQLKGGDET